MFMQAVCFVALFGDFYVKTYLKKKKITFEMKSYSIGSDMLFKSKLIGLMRGHVYSN
jgi:hypothetical protein